MVLKSRSEVKLQLHPESRWLIVGANKRLMALIPVSAEMTCGHSGQCHREGERPSAVLGQERSGPREMPPADGGRGGV